MIKELLHIIAKDENGDPIHINNAIKGINYFCPGCNDEFVLRKSGKSGKGSRRPHFAHKNLTPNCTPEGYLHSSFKILLLEKIKSSLENKLPIAIYWECIYCRKEHHTNLLGGVCSVEKEFDMKTCRPDIALLNGKGGIFAVIEIIVSHPPEYNVLSFYKTNNIPLINITLNPLDPVKELENLDAKIQHPTRVDFLSNMTCPSYSQNSAQLKRPSLLFRVDPEAIKRKVAWERRGHRL
ncbi:MAG: competence protein CoiA family protein [Chitinispirillaceae bacterium]|jgi:hypothetical protein